MSQGALFTNPGNWTPLSEPGTKFQEWSHVSGWWLQHCGHPTANYPYALYSPDGYMVVSYSGHGFFTLKAAKAAIELAVSGAAKVTFRIDFGACPRRMNVYANGVLAQKEGA